MPVMSLDVPPAERSMPITRRVRSKQVVLVVEDHDDTREMVELYLRHDGFAVSTAAHGLQALECIEHERPCLILLDLMMPVMDGIAFATELRASQDPAVAATPIVLLTALSDTEEAMRQTSAVDVLRKPISFERMIDVVERHCTSAT